RPNRLERPTPGADPFHFQLRLREVRHHGQAEPDRRLPELERGGVERVRRDAYADAVRERAGDAVAVPLEALVDLRRPGPEDLDVDDPAQSDLVAGGRRRAAEARV